MQLDSGRLRPAALALLASLAALIAPPPALANTSGTPAPPPAITQPALPAVPLPPSQKPVRIGVGRSVLTAEVKAAGGLYVVGDGAIHWESPPGQVVKVNLLNGKLQVVGLAKAFTGPVRLVPRPSPTPNYGSYKGLTYRGEMEIMISPADQKLAVVNVVNLEDYLLGVVPREMEPSWPLEALKAQAVAARTFTLNNLGKRASEGYSLTDTESDQVYGGVTAERPGSTQAVLSTKGQVVTFNGLMISTYYFGSSGGYTENNEYIWSGTPRDYLRAVPDQDKWPGNFRYLWVDRFTTEELVQALKAKNQDVGAVLDVKPGAASPSGRPAQWQVVGSSRTATFTMEGFRWLLGLYSHATSAKYTAGRTYQTTESVSVAGANRAVQTRSVQGVYVVGAARTAQAAQGAVTAAGSQPTGYLEVTGGGNGHRVGMSQWGAYGLAQFGFDHVKILTHYYRGTKVETR